MICARGGSKGVPWKNFISPFDGQNIYTRIKQKIEASKFSGCKVVVNTDSAEIIDLAQAEGIETYKRPLWLGERETRLVQVNKEFLSTAGIEYEYFVNISPVAPFLTTKTLNHVFRAIESGKHNCGGTVTEHKGNDHPALAMISGSDTRVRYLIDQDIRYPRQLRAKTFFANGAIFFRKRDLIRGDLKTNDLDKSFFPVFISDLEAINIDTRWDWNLAKVLADYFVNEAGEIDGNLPFKN